MITTIIPQQLQDALALRDLTDAGDGPHCMQLLVGALTSRLAEEWHAKLMLHRGPRVVSIYDNYDALGYPPHGAARDARYTRYVDQGHLLRTQTSAAIPYVLRALAEQPLDENVLITSRDSSGAEMLSTASTWVSCISWTCGASAVRR